MKAREVHTSKLSSYPREYAPPILFTRSSDSSSDELSPRSSNWRLNKQLKKAEVRDKVGKMLRAMKVTFSSSIHIVEEDKGTREAQWQESTR
ncbi:hypothetical protein AMTR_s00009p00162240 [Amborella trichopoda]|uniref:Uncharacterized protein n=1 Tax=Amborella trichopoda TaxID=13333 RepID=W1NHE4_AMBTC|nr:hypothetical protein AMTR_s00009p00162240 [Amborella trichopoda]